MKSVSAVVLAIVLLAVSANAGYGKPPSPPDKAPDKVPMPVASGCGSTAHPLAPPAKDDQHASSTSPALAGSPLVAPVMVGSIHFGEATPDPGHRSPMHGTEVVSIDDRGRFGALGWDSFVLLDSDGKQLRSIPLPKMTCFSLTSAWVSGNRWIVLAFASGKSRAYWIDAQTGTVTPIEGFPPQRVAAVTRSRDGGFVVVAVSEKPTLVGPDYVGELIAYDSQARKRWSIGGFTSHSMEEFMPERIAVTTSNRIVALGRLAKQLRIYGMDGKFLRTIDLAKAWGRDPQSPSGIEADNTGGFYVVDPAGEPSIAHMDGDGRVIAAFQPMHEDLRRFVPSDRFQVDSDGRLWMADRRGLVRLDAKGKVDRTIGERFDADRLTDIADTVVDANGHIYAPDRLTGAVHVFDEQGHRLRVDRPGPNDYKALNFSMAVSASGDVYVNSHRPFDVAGYSAYVHFAPDGKRVGVESLKLKEGNFQHWLFQPHGGKRWVIVDSTKILLVDAKGAILKTIDPKRGRADFITGADVAQDGSLAVATSGFEDSGMFDMGPAKEEYAALVLSPDGERRAAWTLPIHERPIDMAFDGTRFVLLTSSGQIGQKKDAHGKVLFEYEKTAIVVMDAKGKPLFHFLADARGGMFLVQQKQGRELWIRAAVNRFDRYTVQ